MPFGGNSAEPFGGGLPLTTAQLYPFRVSGISPDPTTTTVLNNYQPAARSTAIRLTGFVPHVITGLQIPGAVDGQIISVFNSLGALYFCDQDSRSAAGNRFSIPSPAQNRFANWITGAANNCLVVQSGCEQWFERSSGGLWVPIGPVPQIGKNVQTQLSQVQLAAFGNERVWYQNSVGRVGFFGAVVGGTISNPNDEAAGPLLLSTGAVASNSASLSAGDQLIVAGRDTIVFSTRFSKWLVAAAIRIPVLDANTRVDLGLSDGSGANLFSAQIQGAAATLGINNVGVFTALGTFAGADTTNYHELLIAGDGTTVSVMVDGTVIGTFAQGSAPGVHGCPTLAVGNNAAAANESVRMTWMAGTIT